MRSPASLFLAGTIVLGIAGHAFAQGRAAVVGVQTVEHRELSETVPVFAEIVTSRDGSVASRIEGNVDKVHVLAGTRVAEGDLLAELNTELLEIAIRQSEASAAEASAVIETARVRLEQHNRSLKESLPCGSPDRSANGSLMIPSQSFWLPGQSWPRRKRASRAAKRNSPKRFTVMKEAESRLLFPAS